LVPVLLAAIVLAAVCALRIWNPDFPDRLERITYDFRVRTAQKYPQPVSTNLAFVAMEDSSIAAVNAGRVNGQKLGYHSGLYWQRQVYGRLVEELAAEGAQAIAFDILFGELRPDHPQVQMADGVPIESDEFFALQMARAGNVITAFTPEVPPVDLFATNSLALGDISTDKDSDGALRRMKSFNLDWHPVFRSAASQYGVDLSRAKIEPGKIELPLPNGTNITVTLDKDGNFDLADYLDTTPPGWKRFDKPYTRVWDMGIVLAAQALHLDLSNAVVDLPHGKITLRGVGGLQRVIPVDANGYFYIDWRLTPEDLRITRAPIENLLLQDRLRLEGNTNGLSDDFKGKLVIVGSAAQGNDLTDRGATPLEKETLLVSKHWNVANSIITGEFIWRTSLSADLAIIILFGALTAFITCQLRAITAFACVTALMVAYFGGAIFLFIHYHWWLPVIYPICGAMLALHGILLVHLVVFEQQDKRRVKGVFSKMISPEVMNELLAAKKLEVGGSHREISVFFADVRGFTSLTDRMQETVAEHIRSRQVDLTQAEGFFEESARETLETVNLYLSAVAEVVKKNGGTLDKYIGDCVMAFWNAPVPNEKHASACVQAAIDAQRAILELNEKRQADNPARELDNQSRLAAGLPPRPLHTALQLGTGVNTGMVTVGLMGSSDHGFNYTVFGREVNLASRLEGVSGSGRIIISDMTYFHLLRHAPELASKCVELFPVTVKGIRDAVRIYEVPWQPAGGNAVPPVDQPAA
jgi:class 3 adenylate cyclase/CHASE2 domain-containing sensor protein